MRTTIDLPEALHRVALSLAQHRGQTFSQTVVALIENGLAAQAQPASGARSRAFTRHPQTGLPVARSRRVVTPQDVSALDDKA